MDAPAEPESRLERNVAGANLSRVARVLAERRDDVLAGWIEATARQPFHAGRRERAVADHIPRLFDAVVGLLQRAAPRGVEPGAPLDDPDVLSAAREHARVRFEQGLQPAEVATEFRLLRQEIGHILRRHVDDDAPTSDIIGAELLVHDALDGATTLALAALTAHIEEVREDFLATTVHDTQQPITTIKGLAQLAERALRRPEPDVQNALDKMQRIAAEADRMSELLTTLGDVSRLTLGRLSLEPGRTDLVEVVRDALGRFPQTTAARIRLDAAPGDDTSGNWDARMLSRVIANLISNAAKYSPEDSPIDVAARGEPGDQGVLLTVRDYGIGLGADEIAGLFRRYGRGRGATDRGIQGLGLGLYLSHGIVEAHGGQVWAESAGRDLGTTVSVRLPRIIPPVPGEQGASSTLPPAAD